MADPVGPDVEVPLACGWVLLQELVHQDKHLLHHRILSEVVTTFDQLPSPLAIRSDAGEDFGQVDTPG